MTTYRTTFLAVAGAFLISCSGDSKARDHVAAIVSNELGDALNPRVAFARDSTHLLVHIDTTTVASLSDSAFDVVARRIASVAVREYSRIDALDSITVSAVSPPRYPNQLAPRTDTGGVKIYRPPPPEPSLTMLVQVHRRRTYPVPLPTL
jgi:hypothetical protein